MSELRPARLGHAECQVEVSNTPGLKGPADHRDAAARPWVPPGSSWWQKVGSHPVSSSYAAPSAPPLPMPPAQPRFHPTQPQPQQLKRSCWSRKWMLLGCFVLGAALIGSIVALVVLRKKGALGGGDGDGSAGALLPLPYYQRTYNTTAEPAFASALHPWLLGKEQAAMNLTLTADVIVVGAGIAGLRAAQILAGNLSVLVLEARGRVGGRIHSAQFAGLPAELGAQFIWGSESGIDGGGGNPVTQLANVVGLTRVAAASGGAQFRTYGPDAHPLSDSRLTSLGRWSSDLLALASSAATNQTLADVLQSTQMQARLGASPANSALLQAAAQGQYGGQYGAQLAALSAPYFNNESSYGGADNIALGGFSSVSAMLAAQLAANNNADLRLNTPVSAILHDDSNATVFTAWGEALTAQYVVLTAPLGVLQQAGVVLEPGLPEQGAAALGRLGVGRLEKLWLDFDAAFWSDGVCGSGEAAAPCQQLVYLAPVSNTSGWRRFINMAAYTGKPVLVALASAAWAEALDGLSDEEAVDSALADLAVLFPGAAPASRLRSYQLSRWGLDAHARGSFSYYAVGSSPSDRATLAEPQSGSLVLAGEAASVLYPGTVHGAYLSGEEAAYRVLDAAGELPQCGSSSGSAEGASDGEACVATTGAGDASALALADCVCEWPPFL